MKRSVIIVILLISFSTTKLAKAQSIIGNTQVEYPFYTNQRAICRDINNYIHVVWMYNSTTIAYARSSDEGENWEKIYFSYPSPSLSKSTPHISCDGNYILISYAASSSGIIGISPNSGLTWEFNTLIPSCVDKFILGEIRENRIYIIYQTQNSEPCGFGDIIFLNSSDLGETWGPSIVILNGFYNPRGFGVYYSEPSFTIYRAGSSNEKIHVVAKKCRYTSEGFAPYFISYTNSTPQSEIDLVSGIFYNPSIISIDSNVYVSYHDNSKIYLNLSSNYGVSWTGKRIDSITDTSIAQYPSIGVDKENLPIIIWQQNDTTNNKGWNLIMKKFDGTNWIPEEGYWITDDTNIHNKYPNLNSKLGEITEFVWKRGDDIVYSKISEFFQQITLLPATGELVITSPILPPEIKLVGDRKYLNIFWKGEYWEKERKEIAIKCFLNCFNPGDNLELNCAGYQNCTSTTLASTQAVCTIPEPQYNFTNLNLVVCKVFDPSFPEVEYTPYPNISFWTLNFSLLPLKNISASVGSSVILSLAIKNLGLLEDSYRINITPLTNPNFISIKDNLVSLNVKSNDLGSQNIKITPLFSTSIELGIWAYSTSPEWFDCNSCPSGFVCEASSGKCSKYISLKIESGNSSLSEISSLEIIFLILIALFLIYKGL